MKKFAPWIVSACLLVALARPSAAALWTDDYADAMQQARAESRFVLLDFTGSDWCGWCKLLDAEVFSKSEFKDYAKKNLVCVTVDFPRGFALSGKTVKQNEALAKEHGITGYPSIILLDPDGKAIAKTGYKAGGAKPYVEHLEAYIAPVRAKFGAVKTAPAGGATAGGVVPGAGYRTWTSSKGATIEARMEQRVGNVLHLRTREGKLVTIDVGGLSTDDQAFLKQPPSLP